MQDNGVPHKQAKMKRKLLTTASCFPLRRIFYYYKGETETKKGRNVVREREKRGRQLQQLGRLLQ